MLTLAKTDYPSIEKERKPQWGGYSDIFIHEGLDGVSIF